MIVMMNGLVVQSKSIFSSPTFYFASSPRAFDESSAVSRRPLILIVDDNRSFGMVLCEALEDEGYRVRLAFDGDEALRTVDGEMPDLVLSDIAMPNIDGLTLIQELRTRQITCPVVLMSAHATSVDIPDVRFMMKPVDIDELFVTVQQSLPPSPRS